MHIRARHVASTVIQLLMEALNPFSSSVKLETFARAVTGPAFHRQILLQGQNYRPSKSRMSRKPFSPVYSNR